MAEKPAYDPRLHAIPTDDDADRKPPARRPRSRGSSEGGGGGGGRDRGGGVADGSRHRRVHRGRDRSGPPAIDRSGGGHGAPQSTNRTHAAAAAPAEEEGKLDDAEYARRLQEELYLQARTERQRAESESQDSAYSRRMQESEPGMGGRMGGGGGGDSGRSRGQGIAPIRRGTSSGTGTPSGGATGMPHDRELSQRSQQAVDDEALARRLMEEGSFSMGEGAGAGIGGGARRGGSGAGSSMDSDEALARRLQQEGSIRLGGGSGMGGDAAAAAAAAAIRRDRFATGRADTNSLDLEELRRQAMATSQRNDSQLSYVPQGDDEALARRYFEHSLQRIGMGGQGRRGNGGGGAGSGGTGDDHRPHSSAGSGMNQDVPPSLLGRGTTQADAVLARQLMEESMAEMEARMGARGAGHPAATSVGAGGGREDEALARQLMRDSLQRQINGETGRSGSVGASSGRSGDGGGTIGQPPVSEDDDLEIARRMQALETMGYGRLNSLRGVQSSAGGGGSTAPPSGRSQTQSMPPGGAETEYQRMERLRQEQEDELLARTIAENDISAGGISPVGGGAGMGGAVSGGDLAGGTLASDMSGSRGGSGAPPGQGSGSGLGSGPGPGPGPVAPAGGGRPRRRGSTGTSRLGTVRNPPSQQRDPRRSVSNNDTFPGSSAPNGSQPGSMHGSSHGGSNSGSSGGRGPPIGTNPGPSSHSRGASGSGDPFGMPPPLPDDPIHSAGGGGRSTGPSSVTSDSPHREEEPPTPLPPVPSTQKRKKKRGGFPFGNLLKRQQDRGGTSGSSVPDRERDRSGGSVQGGGSSVSSTNGGDSGTDQSSAFQAIPPPPSRTPGPLPHSVSIRSSLPMSPQPKKLSSGRGFTPLSDEKIKNQAQQSPHSGGGQSSNVPKCDVCGLDALSYLSTLDKKYHPDCFKCMGCHEIIDPSGPFAFTVGDDGERHPLHRKCYAELFGIKCAVCKESIPTGPDGKVSYVKHPFFDTEQMCPKHAKNPGRRCTGCHRFEPIGNGFADLGDAGRCVCLSCCRTVIVDSEDAKPLWVRVVHFLETTLGLPIWPDMRNVPILVVGYDALNEQIQNSAHSGSSQIMTRGLCLSEHQSGRRIALHRMKFDRNNKSFAPRDAESKGYTYFQVPDASKINPDSSVTAILCMSGLPSDLTASVLAHEATHAWIKLHPNFDITKPIPLKVEEGCCQLVAYLFLCSGLPQASNGNDDSGPSDEKLRQYFKFSIETDENEIYGQGYRTAAKAYAQIGIEALLSHVVMYRDFPEV